MSGRALGTLLAGLALLLLYLPLAGVAAFSLNASPGGLRWEGLTLDWYRRLLGNEQVLLAARNTLVLAGASTLVAAALGTLLALGLDRFPWPRRAQGAADVAVDVPVVTPDIVFAAALVVAFLFLRKVAAIFEPGLAAMIVGHVTFELAFVALVVRARLALLGPTLFEAASDLYADRLFRLRKVTLPLVAPAVLVGALLAFTLSLDDFVISFFTASPRSGTLPLHIYASLRRGLSPELHALSTLIVLSTVGLVLALQLGGRRRESPT